MAILYPLGFGSASTSALDQYISSITPKKTTIGASVVIVGSGFSTTGNSIVVGGVVATITSESSTSITFTVPSVSIQTQDIILTKATGSSIYAPNGITIVDKTLEYENISPMPNSYFHFLENTDYDSDKDLYRNLQAEAFNIYGTPLMYYVVSYNTSYDLLFGEDNNRRIARKFPISARFELPKEEDAYAKFGLENLDNFEMHVNQKHFTTASKYNTSGVGLYPPETATSAISAYTSVEPKVGDMLKSEYNDVFYEILTVHEEEEMFLQTKHAWKFIVRVFRDSNISLSADTSASMDSISAVNNIDDILEVNDYITSASEAVLYTSATGEASIQQSDIDSGWF